jgi:hypothetical protein
VCFAAAGERSLLSIMPSVGRVCLWIAIGLTLFNFMVVTRMRGDIRAVQPLEDDAPLPKSKAGGKGKSKQQVHLSVSACPELSRKKTRPRGPSVTSSHSECVSGRVSEPESEWRVRQCSSAAVRQYESMGEAPQRPLRIHLFAVSYTPLHPTATPTPSCDGLLQKHRLDAFFPRQIVRSLNHACCLPTTRRNRSAAV